jgi:hypothetical protein
MKQREPAYHPVDVFFQRQAEKIPVAYDPQQWEHLRAMLDQHPGTPPPPPGEAGPPDSPQAKPGPAKWLRLGWLAFCVLAFMQLLPSAQPLDERLSAIEAAPDAARTSPAPPPAERAAPPPLPAAPPTGLAGKARQPLPQAAPPAAAETGGAEPRPAETPLFAAPEATAAQGENQRAAPRDSLLQAPFPAPPIDSLAEPRKARRKHLFW